MRLRVGVGLSDVGAAIVVTELIRIPSARKDWLYSVVLVDRPPATVDALAGWLEDFAEDQAEHQPRIVVDHFTELGDALLRTLTQEFRDRDEQDGRHVLKVRQAPAAYMGIGRDRRELVTRLSALERADRIEFAAGLDHGPALRKALNEHRPEIDDSGIVGSELKIAVCLTTLSHFASGVPRARGHDRVEPYMSIEHARGFGSQTGW
jgi:hypothetical protein